MSRSRSQSKPTTYSHLLYVNDSDRAQYIGMSRSVSSASSARSIRSLSSTASRASTVPSSISRKSIQSPKWADDHYPLITSTNPASVPESIPRSHACFHIAREMAQIHNTLIRAINASYNHSFFIKPSTQEAADFLMFNQLIAKTLDHHHHTEDDFLFPEIEKLLNKPGAMEENIQGHESFLEGFGVFEKYVTVTKPTELNGTTLRHIIESFAPNLVQHMHDEIPTLMSLCVLDSGDLKKVWARATKLATKDAELHTDAPFLLSCQDKEFAIDGERCKFPEMPWVLEAIVRNCHAKRYAGAWRFCPSDMYSKRRHLAAF